MDKEEWKPLTDDPRYFISNQGRIISTARGKEKEMKHGKDRCGYHRITTSKDGIKQTRMIHQLVAKTFVDGYSEGLEVNHKDGIKDHNEASNLEWVTTADNLRHAYKTGLNYGPPKKKVQIVETGKIYDSEKECAKSINGHISGVNACLNGRRKRYKGYHFEFYTD